MVNLSSANLRKHHEAVLKLGLNFAVAPRKPQTPHLLAAIEKSFWKLPQSEGNVIRTKIMFILQKHRPPPCALSGLECFALKELQERQDIVIIRVDKGNATVILDKDKYDDKIKTLLQDPSTYVETTLKPMK